MASLKIERGISIDIETLGTSTSAPVLSIGACCFESQSLRITSEFYVNVELGTTDMSKIDAATFYWWMSQSNEARTALFKDRQPLPEALSQLTAYIDSNAEFLKHGIWANPPGFDLTILRSAFEHVGLRVPWHYTHIRDYATLKRVVVGFLDSATPVKVVAHNALDDAKYQAMKLMYAGRNGNLI